MASQEALIHSVSEFVRTLGRASAISDVLNDLAERVTAVAGVACAGVSVLESGQFRSAAVTDERSAGLERVQEEEQAGPGVDACLAGKPVTLADLPRMVVTAADLPGTSRGWARYQQAAREAGIAAVAAAPMTHDSEKIGAVDLYCTAPREWSAADLAAAVILADMAACYLVQARELGRQSRLIGQLSRALDSRIVIEQAKGVLAAERNISVDEAFEVLRQHARSHSVSLRSVAEAVVNLGLRP